MPAPRLPLAHRAFLAGTFMGGTLLAAVAVVVGVVGSWYALRAFGWTILWLAGLDPSDLAAFAVGTVALLAVSFAWTFWQEARWSRLTEEDRHAAVLASLQRHP